MKNSNKHHAIHIALLSLAIASSAMAGESFYERKAEGWFWYEVEPEEPEVEEEPKLLPPPPAPLPMPSPTKAKPEGPAPFSAEWVRVNLPKYKDAAWNNPTVENLKAFMYIQRFALDRSEQFSDAAQLAVLGDPVLDEVSRRPTASYASQNLDREASAKKNSMIQAIGERAGLFFFFSSQCPYCETQAKILQMLERNASFTILPISTDGSPLPNSPWTEFKKDNGQAKKLGIQVYPALYLVNKAGEFAPISQGAVSLPDLHNRILVAAIRKGWITQEEYNKTRPILNFDTTLANLLEPALFENDTNEQTTTNNDGFIPPEQLVEIINNKF